MTIAAKVYRACLCALTVLGIASPATSWAQTSSYKLVEAGTLSVAITGDMPGLVAKDGKLVGYDGEILQIAADNLKLKVKPVPMEWSGAIAAVQAGRIDVIGGNVAWTEQRGKTLAMTDPTAYFQNGVTQRKSTSWTKLSDLEGKRVGSITGFSFVPELRKIKDIQLSLHDTSDAALRDLLAGRLDAMVGDPPVLNYAISQNPTWNLQNIPFNDPHPEFPLLTGQGRQYVFGLAKDNQALSDAISGEIRKLWGMCDVKKIGTKYGQTNPATFTPASANFRVGVDRPEGWTPPSCK